MASSTGLPFASPANSLQWSEDVLYSVGAPLTQANVGVFEAMAQAESSTGFGLNPAGNTQREPADQSGSASIAVPGNSAGVQEYSSWRQSLNAMRSVIEQSNNAGFLASLRSGTASEQSLAEQITAPGASWYGDATASLTPRSVTFTEAHPATSTGTGQDQGLFGRIRHDIAAGADAASGGVNTAVNAPANAAGSVLSGAFSGVLSPIVGDLKRDIYDWAFVVFGLVLIVVGLVVTFHDAAGDAAKAGAAAAAA